MRKCDEYKLVGIICNKCGDSVDVSEDEYGWLAEPFREFDLVYGYGSGIYDFSGVRFDLCEYCVEELVGAFPIPAESRDYEVMQAWTSGGSPFVYLRHTDEEPLSQAEMDARYVERHNPDEVDSGDVKGSVVESLEEVKQIRSGDIPKKKYEYMAKEDKE